MKNNVSIPFVFVLMPFSKDFNDFYERGIKKACNDAGAKCERVDEQFYDEGVLQRIYSQIAIADVVIADMTGRNPNVFYETGYAHALSQRVILLTQEATDIPFDLKHYSHIVYGKSITQLKEKLKEKILWALNQPKKGLNKTADSFWLGHDLLWVINCAADIRVKPKDVWYGIKLSIEHAASLGLDKNQYILKRLNAQEKRLNKIKHSDSQEFTSKHRLEVIQAAYEAIVTFGSNINEYQPAYKPFLHSEIGLIWEEFKENGLGIARTDLIDLIPE